MKEAPTDPTDPKMDDGVQKIPVPIIPPTLENVAKVQGMCYVAYDLHQHSTAEHPQMTLHAPRGIW